MKQAVALPYVQDQDGPSQPLRKLVPVVGNKDVDAPVIHDVFVGLFGGDDTIEIDWSDGQPFGNIVVSDEWGNYLYLTFVE